MHPALVIALVLAATWDAWRWLAVRVATSPEEAGVLALTVAVIGALAWPRLRSRGGLHEIPLSVPALLVALYAASHFFAPAIVRCAIAATALLACLYRAGLGERPAIAFWALPALALPVVPSLQMTLGYPMRLVSAALTVPLLRLHGLAVERQGTFLLWRGEMVQFDAPCSGVSMLWAALVLTVAGATLLRLSLVALSAALLVAAGLTLAGNVLRAASLFYLEASLIPGAAPWWHEGIGLAAFVLAAAATAWCLVRLRELRVPRCRGRLRALTRHLSPLTLALSPSGRRGAGDAVTARFLTMGVTVPGIVPARAAMGLPLASRQRGGGIDGRRWWQNGVAALLLAACTVGAGSPLLARNGGKATEAGLFPGFPTQFEGRSLTPMALSPREDAFARDFPGRIGRFTDGRRELIVRWVAGPTRKLHPAADCLRAAGYRITPLPMRRSADGAPMGCLKAERGAEALTVCELILGAAGESWPDVPAWYWESLLSRHRGPAWSYVVASR